MSELKQKIMEQAKKLGADMVGFASLERFAPEYMPKKILPAAKSVIGLGFRVLRGSLRGVEEGTTYYQYTTMGIELLEEIYMPQVMMRLSGVIEDAGYIAVPQKNHQMILQDAEKTNPEMNYHRVWRGINMPQLDFTKAAYACGLGEIGASGQLLTDEFGPFQRVCFIITDAELEEDPLISRHLCDACGKCKEACPGQALQGEKDYQLDTWQCAAYLRGGNIEKNPFLAPDFLTGHPDREALLHGKKQLTMNEAKAYMAELNFYPPMKHAYATNVCGRACDRACYIHLEEKGVLKRKFANKFRDGEDWKLNQ